MKTSLYILASLLCGLVSCKKYLDVKPKGLEVANSYDHFNGLFNNTNLLNYSIFTPSASGLAGGKGVMLPVVMSDEVMLDPQYSSTLPPSALNAFKWLPDIYPVTEQPAEWAAFYIQNYTYNVIVQDVMSAQDGTDQQKRSLLAEARANRALMHFMVLNLFAKPYNAATASTDPGIPIIVKPEANAVAGGRQTVKEVYDFIIKELKESIPDLREKALSRLRLSRAAGEFILGQVYFTMGDYEKALTELNVARNLLAASEVPMNLYDYNQWMDIWAPPSSNFPANIPVVPNNEEEIFQKRVSFSSFVFSNNLFIDPAYESVYGSSDQRLKMFRSKSLMGIDLPYKARRSPSTFNYGPSVPDLFLMIAECKARTEDLSGALDDLSAFRTKRMPPGDAVVTITDRDELTKFIVEERLREYACTGKRWFDLRRLSNDPLFSSNTYTHKNGPDTYTLTTERLTLRIPKFVKESNPGITDNP